MDGPRSRRRRYFVPVRRFLGFEGRVLNIVERRLVRRWVKLDILVRELKRAVDIQR